ncbi:MAG: 4-alpha-glucanotransferase [Faecalibacterium prausnitzii]
MLWRRSACSRIFWPLRASTSGSCRPQPHRLRRDSPHQSCSAFAGNPYFIDLDALKADGLLTAAQLKAEKWVMTRFRWTTAPSTPAAMGAAHRLRRMAREVRRPPRLRPLLPRRLLRLRPCQRQLAE